MYRMITSDRHSRDENFYAMIVMVVLMLCGFYIRIGGLAGSFFTTDDLWHLVIAKQPTIMEVLRANLAEDVHPPLSYLMLHFMLKISDNEYFLKCISLVPGILLIPMGYMLGKERFGIAAGITIAFFITFSEWTVVLSGAIRAYSLMLLCAMVALWAMFRFDKTRHGGYVIGYFAAMFLAIELAHSIAFFIFATGSLWFFKNIRQKNALKFIGWWVLGHMLLMACVVSYLGMLHYSAPDGYYIVTHAKDPWHLFYLYFTAIFVFIFQNTSSLYVPLFVLGMILCMGGLYYSVSSKAADILYLFVCTLLLLISADYLQIFPFSAFMRNYIFLVIPLYLLMGGMAEIGVTNYQKAMRYKHCSIAHIKTNSDISIIVALLILCLKIPARWNGFFPVVVVVTVSIAVTLSIREDSFFNKTRAGAYEAAIKTKNLDRFLGTLSANIKPGDIVITSNDTSWLFRYRLNLPPIIRHDAYVAELKTYQVPFYFDGREARSFSQFFSAFGVQRFFKSLQHQVDFSKINRIWFVHIGWKTDFLHQIMTPAIQPPDALDYCKKDMPKCDNEKFHIAQERYNLSWAFLRSNQVTPQLILSDQDEAITMYTMTPQFVEDEIIKKKFIVAD